MAEQKEALAALPGTCLVAAEQNQRQINQLFREIARLEKQIATAQAGRKSELESQKKEKEDVLHVWRKQRQEDRLQARVAAKYKDVLAAEAKCKAADQPLLRVLHGMNGVSTT